MRISDWSSDVCSSDLARLYGAVSNPAFAFHPAAITHNVGLIGSIRNFVAIHSALAVELLGQAYSEVGSRGLMSGPGGAPDYAAGARLGDRLATAALAPIAARSTPSRRLVPNDLGEGKLASVRGDAGGTCHTRKKRG